MLRELGGEARGVTADVLLRANLDVPLPAGAALVMGGATTPFGMDDEGLERCAALIPGTGLRLRGSHAHLASGLGVRVALRAAAQVPRFARRWCARHALREPVITLGGGMDVSYQRPGATFGWEEYGRGLAELAGEASALPGERLRIEPGRAVTA